MMLLTLSTLALVEPMALRSTFFPLPRFPAGRLLVSRFLGTGSPDRLASAPVLAPASLSSSLGPLAVQSLETARLSSHSAAAFPTGSNSFCADDEGKLIWKSSILTMPCSAWLGVATLCSTGGITLQLPSFSSVFFRSSVVSSFTTSPPFLSTSGPAMALVPWTSVGWGSDSSRLNVLISCATANRECAFSPLTRISRPTTLDDLRKGAFSLPPTVLCSRCPLREVSLRGRTTVLGVENSLLALRVTGRGGAAGKLAYL